MSETMYGRGMVHGNNRGIVLPLLLIIGVLPAVSGCLPMIGVVSTTHHNDVSDDPRYKTDYEVGGIYALNKDSSIVPKYSLSGRGKGKFGIVSGTRNWSTDTIYYHYRDRDPWFIEYLENAPDPQGRIQEGTRIEVVQLERTAYRKLGVKPSGGYVIAYGMILDGPYEGTKVLLPGLWRLPDETGEKVPFYKKTGDAFMKRVE
jgi:hypothetical protein